MRIKVCGVTRPRDARLAARLGAWAVGMIFVPNTPRHLSLALARRVRAAIPKGVLAVGVFRRPDAETVRAVVKSLRLDAVQIDGAVPDGIAVPVLHVVSPRAARVASARASRGAVGPRDYLLIEPPRTLADRRAGRVPSASARRAAWRAAARRRGGARVILAGGLTPENVADAAAARPWAVDVSSGVENRPGIKDAKRLRAFFAAANARGKRG